MNKLGHRRSKWKVQRALGLELPGLGRAGALEKRAYGPGVHGPDARRKKVSSYGLQLKEKQKLLFNYVIREEQLRRFVRKARSGRDTTAWVDTLITLLESRLDNLVFRLGWARSIPAARQLVTHGHVHVDGKRASIGSMLVKVGSSISLSEKGKKMTSVLSSLESPRLTLAPFFEYAGSGNGEDKLSAKLISSPGHDYLPFELNSMLVAEYYASRGV